MVSVREKTIKGKTYLYAEYSFRLPDNSIKKISKLIKKREDTTKVSNYFLQEEIRLHQEYAKKTYSTDVTLTKEQLAKIEKIRVEYKHLVKKLTKKQFQDIIDRFTVNFTYESNALEGNSLTLKDVTLLLTEKRVPENKDLREIYETRNMREATQQLFKKKIPLTKEGIISLHKTVVKDTEVSTDFKKIPNFLLMRKLTTTPPEKVEEKIDELLDWLKKNKQHPLKAATEFHARFEQIHPFEDGNGRVGRLLLNAILLNAKYPPIIIRKSSRIAYFEGLAAHDEGHTRKFEQFILKKFKQTYEKFFKVYVGYI